MCERCDELTKALKEGRENTKEANVLITAMFGEIIDTYGAPTALDMLANVFGFIDYKVGKNNPDDEGENGRNEMRNLFMALCTDYFETSQGLLDEERGTEGGDIKPSSPTMH